MIDLSIIRMIQTLYCTGDKLFISTAGLLKRSFGCSKAYYYSKNCSYDTFPMVSFFNILDVLVVQLFQNLNKKPCF
jgi:hypothetical protein